MDKQLSDFLVKADTKILQVMNRLEVTEKKILFVVEDETRLVGALTDGDIRRWILAKGRLDDTIAEAFNKKPFFVRPGFNVEELKSYMVERNISCVPVVNDRNEILQLLFWETLFDSSLKKRSTQLSHMPVVIMAGGRGTRLDPFTKILPKPLIPIGDKTILEVIIESFLGYGVGKFYLSVNYKSKIIKSYFEELNPPYQLEYIEEEKPLGTGGSLKYLQGRVSGSILVTNCDIIIKADYGKMVEFHKQMANDITLVVSLKNYPIPYGVCEIDNGGALTKLKEKPEYNLLVNTGMYVLQAQTLELIPDNEFFHITQLIDSVKENRGKIGVFPISENAWLDTGQWAEYQNALKQLNLSL
jgi:dTDP-glucose pyrophosphorylase/predicted transcriptional regulator